MPRTFRAAAAFWALCLLLAAVESRTGGHWLGGLLFLLALPILVSYLAWVQRAILYWSLPQPLPLLVYACTVLGTTIAILLLGLLSGHYLFADPGRV
jgi:hypothetical protein